MEFQKNLAEIKELSASEPETFMPESTKREINELLFSIMPPNTTLRDMEDLAVALYATVQMAWNQ